MADPAPVAQMAEARERVEDIRAVPPEARDRMDAADLLAIVDFMEAERATLAEAYRVLREAVEALLAETRQIDKNSADDRGVPRYKPDPAIRAAEEAIGRADTLVSRSRDNESTDG